MGYQTCWILDLWSVIPSNPPICWVITNLRNGQTMGTLILKRDTSIRKTFVEVLIDFREIQHLVLGKIFSYFALKWWFQVFLSIHKRPSVSPLILLDHKDFWCCRIAVYYEQSKVARTTFSLTVSRNVKNNNQRKSVLNSQVLKSSKALFARPQNFTHILHQLSNCLTSIFQKQNTFTISKRRSQQKARHNILLTPETLYGGISHVEFIY